METHSSKESKLTNLRLFLWKDDDKNSVVPSDKGLLIFNISYHKEESASLSALGSPSTDRDHDPIVVSFELTSLFQDNFAKQIIKNTRVFGPKTTKALARQVTDYIKSCFKFRRVIARGPRLVFVADVLVDGLLEEESKEKHDVDDEDVVTNSRPSSGFYLMFKILRRVCSRIPFANYRGYNNSGSMVETMIEEAQEHEHGDETSESNNANYVANNNNLDGSDHAEDYATVQEEQERHLVQSDGSYNTNDSAQVPTNQQGLRHLRRRPREDLSNNRDYNIFDTRTTLSYSSHYNIFDTRTTMLYSSFRNFSFGGIQPSEDSEDNNMGCARSEIEEVEDNNVEEFNHVLNILRSFDDQDLSARPANRAKKVVQDHRGLKSLSKIKPTIEFAKEEEFNEDSTCSICLEIMSTEEENIKMIRCKHVYHGSCLLKWLPRNQSCPFCRTSSLLKICLQC